MKRLTRHIRNVHNNEESVQYAMKQSKREGLNIFKKLKRDGILKHVVDKIGKRESDAPVMRERRSGNSSEVVICGKCSAVLSKRNFTIHKKHCIGESTVEPVSLRLDMFVKTGEFNDDFRKNILEKFRGKEAGHLCRSDPMITNIGQRMYDKLRKKKIRSRKLESRSWLICEDWQKCSLNSEIYLTKGMLLMVIRNRYSLLTCFIDEILTC